MSASRHEQAEEPTVPPSELTVHLRRFRDSWCRADGLLATVFTGGSCIDDTPLIADLGDVLPFLTRLGLGDLAREQWHLARQHCPRGLFVWRGRQHLFENHDLLLGLLDAWLYFRDSSYLGWLEEAVSTITSEHECRGFLTDLPKAQRGGWFARADGFNAGYIEVLVDLYEHTRQHRYLDTAIRWARTWFDSPIFRRYGLLGPRVWPTAPQLSLVLSPLYKHGPIQLFKSTTNGIWGVLRLYQITGDENFRTVLRRFVSGFSQHLVQGTSVRQTLRAPFDHSLYASMPALDLLCDLANGGIERSQCLELVAAIVSGITKATWPNHLVELHDGAGVDHLDMMTDLGVGLCKAGEMLGRTELLSKARAGWQAQWTLHRSDHGLIQAVRRDGSVADPRIIVKYQALALKVMFLDQAVGSIYSDRSLWSLLRDR